MQKNSKIRPTIHDKVVEDSLKQAKEKYIKVQAAKSKTSFDEIMDKVQNSDEEHPLHN